MPLHRNQTGDDIHAAPARVYADITARDADTDFNADSTNINKIVRVDSPLSFYVLTSSGTFLEFTSTGLDEWIELADTPSSISATLVVQGNVGGTALEFGQALDITDSPTFAAITIGESVPFADIAGFLMLQNVDIIDSITEATIEVAIDTLLNLTSIQGQSISLSGALTVEADSTINQDLTTDASAILAGLSLDSTTDVLRLPRLTTTQRDALTPLNGFQIFNTTTVQAEVYNGTSWIAMVSTGANIIGTPVDNQLAIWTSSTGIEGDAGLTFDGNTLSIAENFASAQLSLGANAELGFFFDGNDGHIQFLSPLNDEDDLIIENQNERGKIIVRLGSTDVFTVFEIRDGDDEDIFTVLADGFIFMLGSVIAPSINGVNLESAGAATNFLNADAGYTVPGGTPGGAAGDIQFQSATATFSGESALTYDDVNDILSLTGKMNVEGSIESSDAFIFSDDSTQNVAAIPDLSSGRMSTAVLNQVLDVDTEENEIEYIFLRNDGLKMYISGPGANRIQEFDLSTAWDISTATLLQTFNPTTQDNSIRAVSFKSDGLVMYITGSQNDAIFQYDLGTAWNISTAVFNSPSFGVSGTVTNPQSLPFKPDGTSFYTVGFAEGQVFKYEMSTPWDVTTASLDSTFTPSEPSDIVGVGFRADGVFMYVSSGGDALIYEYFLVEPWNITSAVLQGTFAPFDPLLTASSIRGVVVSPYHHKFYFADKTRDQVVECDFGLFIEGDIRNNIGLANINPPTIIVINTQEEFDALATSGVISFSENTAIQLHISITTSDRFVAVAGHTVLISAPFLSGVSLTYSGTGDFFGGTGQLEISNIIIASSSTGTLFNYTIAAGVLIVDNALFSGWDDLGTIIGGNVIMTLVGLGDASSGLTFTNVVSIGLTNVRHLPIGAALASPLFTVETNLSQSSYDFSGMFINSLSSAGSTFDFPTTNNVDARFTVSNVSVATGDMFKQLAFTADFTAVADGSPSTATITAMANNGSGGTTISTTTIFYDDEEVTNSGTTSYNGTFQIFNVVAGVSFDILVAFVADDATGSVDSERLTITLAGGHGVTAGASLKIIESNFYNGFVTALNVATNTLTVNGTFISTNSGSIERDLSLDQTDPRVRGFNNPQVSDSHYIAGAVINDNATANGTIVNGVFTDMVFGTVGSALEAFSNMERWKLVDELNGTFEYIGNEPFDGAITTDYTVESTGGAVNFVFNLLLDSGGGFSDLVDDVEALVNVGSSAESVSKTFPLKAVKGNQIKPNITRVSGTSGITTTHATIYATQ